MLFLSNKYSLTSTDFTAKNKYLSTKISSLFLNLESPKNTPDKYSNTDFKSIKYISTDFTSIKYTKALTLHP